MVGPDVRQTTPVLACKRPVLKAIEHDVPHLHRRGVAGEMLNGAPLLSRPASCRADGESVTGDLDGAGLGASRSLACEGGDALWIAPGKMGGWWWGRGRPYLLTDDACIFCACIFAPAAKGDRGEAQA